MPLGTDLTGMLQPEPERYCLFSLAGKFTFLSLCLLTYESELAPRARTQQLCASKRACVRQRSESCSNETINHVTPSQGSPAVPGAWDTRAALREGAPSRGCRAAACTARAACPRRGVVARRADVGVCHRSPLLPCHSHGGPAGDPSLVARAAPDPGTCGHWQRDSLSHRPPALFQPLPKAEMAPDLRRRDVGAEPWPWGALMGGVCTPGLALGRSRRATSIPHPSAGSAAAPSQRQPRKRPARVWFPVRWFQRKLQRGALLEVLETEGSQQPGRGTRAGVELMAPVQPTPSWRSSGQRSRVDGVTPAGGRALRGILVLLLPLHPQPQLPRRATSRHPACLCRHPPCSAHAGGSFLLPRAPTHTCPSPSPPALPSQN